jgi:hypothetical protein
MVFEHSIYLSILNQRLAAFRKTLDRAVEQGKLTRDSDQTSESNTNRRAMDECRDGPPWN